MATATALAALWLVLALAAVTVAWAWRARKQHAAAGAGAALALQVHSQRWSVSSDASGSSSSVRRVAWQPLPPSSPHVRRSSDGTALSPFSDDACLAPFPACTATDSSSSSSIGSGSSSSHPAAATEPPDSAAGSGPVHGSSGARRQPSCRRRLLGALDAASTSASGLLASWMFPAAPATPFQLKSPAQMPPPSSSTCSDQPLARHALPLAATAATIALSRGSTLLSGRQLQPGLKAGAGTASGGPTRRTGSGPQVSADALPPRLHELLVDASQVELVKDCKGQLAELGQGAR